MYTLNQTASTRKPRTSRHQKISAQPQTAVLRPGQLLLALPARPSRPSDSQTPSVSYKSTMRHTNFHQSPRTALHGLDLYLPFSNLQPGLLPVLYLTDTVLGYESLSPIKYLMP